MATQSNSLQSALQTLGLDPADNENTNNYTTAGVTPASLLTHTVKRDYVILGVTPQEFIEKHGSSAFDFDAIKRHFGLICEDFDDPLAMDTASKAVEFCSKMIYEVKPEARQVRKKDGDKTWRFMFVYKKDGKLQTKVAFVSTYKTDEASYKIETKDVDMSIDSADDQESVEYNEPLQSIKRLFDDSKNTIEIVFHDTDTPSSAQSDLCSENSDLCESENLGKRMRNRPKRFKDYETSFK